jgi:hypothetical protein
MVNPYFKTKKLRLRPIIKPKSTTNHKSLRYQFQKKQKKVNDKNHQNYNQTVLLSCARLAKNNRKQRILLSETENTTHQTKRPSTLLSIKSIGYTSKSIRPDTANIYKRTTKNYEDYDDADASNTSAPDTIIASDTIIAPDTMISPDSIAPIKRLRPHTSNSMTRLPPFSTKDPQRRPYSSHSHRSVRHRIFHDGHWKLKQRLSYFPGFLKDVQASPPTLKFVHCSLKYTKWMQTARNKAKKIPNYVVDQRALIIDPKRKDKVLIATIPRAGQPMEMEIHTKAKKIQKCYRRYIKHLKTDSCNRIILTWRKYLSKKIFQKLKDEHQKHTAIINKMKLKRFQHVLYKWYKYSKRQKSIRAIGIRYMHTSNKSTLNYCLSKWRDECYTVLEKQDNIIYYYKRYKRHKLKTSSLFKWKNCILLKKELRNFIKKRLYNRWKKDTYNTITSRIFGIQWQAALIIQNAYNNMRQRDYENMKKMKIQGDVVRFKEMRKCASIRIQSRIRIFLSHRKYDSRTCTQYIIKNIVKSIFRKIGQINYQQNYRRNVQNEKIRILDENIFIAVWIRESMMNTGKYLKTYNRWPQKCWIRNTIEGKLAMKKAISMLNEKNDIYETSIKHFLRTSLSSKKTISKKQKLINIVEEMRLGCMREQAKKEFQLRWPPTYKCNRCNQSMSNMHVCF